MNMCAISSTRPVPERSPPTEHARCISYSHLINWNTAFVIFFWKAIFWLITVVCRIFTNCLHLFQCVAEFVAPPSSRGIPDNGCNVYNTVVDGWEVPSWILNNCDIIVLTSSLCFYSSRLGWCPVTIIIRDLHADLLSIYKCISCEFLIWFWMNCKCYLLNLAQVDHIAACIWSLSFVFFGMVTTAFRPGYSHFGLQNLTFDLNMDEGAYTVQLCLVCNLNLHSIMILTMYNTCLWSFFNFFCLHMMYCRLYFWPIFPKFSTKKNFFSLSPEDFFVCVPTTFLNTMTS